MSWDEHVQGSLLMGSGFMSKAAIVSQQGAVCAASNLTPTPDEVAEIVKACKGDTSCMANGLKIDGKKYLVTRLNPDEEEIQLKAKEAENDKKCGVSCRLTKSLCVIGVDMGEKDGNSAKKVYECASYLKDC